MTLNAAWKEKYQSQFTSPFDYSSHITFLSLNHNYQEDIAVTGSNPNNFKLLNLLIKFEQNFAPSEYLQSTAKLLKLLLASMLFFMQRYDYKLHYVPFIVKEVFDKVKVGLLSTTIHITLEKVGKVCTLSTP